MVDRVIRLVTEGLSGLPFVEGAALGGSRARGTHTERSDIDIGVYYRPGTLDMDALNLLAARLDDGHRTGLVTPPGSWGPWVNGGGWLTVGGCHVDLILRDVGRVEQAVEDAEQGIVAAHYQPGHPHGYVNVMYRGELAVCRLLYAKDDRLRALKAWAESYPAALRRSLVRVFLSEAEFTLTLVRAYAGTEDRYYFAGHVFRVVSCLNQVLFACGEAYCLNEKRAVALLESLGRAPDGYGAKVNALFEALGRSLFECRDLVERLFDEVKRIASETECCQSP